MRGRRERFGRKGFGWVAIIRAGIGKTVPPTMKLPCDWIMRGSASLFVSWAIAEARATTHKHRKRSELLHSARSGRSWHLHFKFFSKNSFSFATGVVSQADKTPPQPGAAHTRPLSAP